MLSRAARPLKLYFELADPDHRSSTCVAICVAPASYISHRFGGRTRVYHHPSVAAFLLGSARRITDSDRHPGFDVRFFSVDLGTDFGPTFRSSRPPPAAACKSGWHARRVFLVGICPANLDALHRAGN